MERALLQGEREAERALLQKEQKAVDQLQEKLMTLETSIQKERDKVTHNLAQLCAGRQRPGRGGEVPFTPYLIVHSSVESISVEGAARVWAGVWGLLCLGFCSPSGCLGACCSGPSVLLLGSVEAPSWVVSTAQGTGAGE